MEFIIFLNSQNPIPSFQNSLIFAARHLIFGISLIRAVSVYEQLLTFDFTKEDFAYGRHFTTAVFPTYPYP